MDGTVYEIWRDKAGRVHCDVLRDGAKMPLVHVKYHSPDGFEVGYGGSGPHDLALSILCDHYNLVDPSFPVSWQEGQLGLPIRRAWFLHFNLARDWMASRKVLYGEPPARIKASEIDSFVNFYRDEVQA